MSKAWPHNGKPLEQHDNIVVAGYPKSGTIWLSTLLAEVLSCPSVGHVFYEDNKSVAIEGLDRGGDRVVWKTHYPPALTIKGPIRKERIIYVARDVRDVICSQTASYVHHGRGEESFDAPDKTLKKHAPKILGQVTTGKPFAEPWSRGFMKPTDNTSWQDHLKQWSAQGVFLCRYEDLLTHTAQVIWGFLYHINVEVDRDHIAQAIHNQSFEVKKKKLGKNVAAAKMRKGKHGTFSSVLNEKLLSVIQKRCGTVMKELEYC